MIRVFTLFLSTSLSAVLFSCVDETAGKVDKESHRKVDFSHFSPFNLRPYGINAEIQLPDSSTIYGASNEWRIEHELDGFDWKLVLAEDFQLLIEDWGQEDGIAHYFQQIESNEQVKILEKSDSFFSYSLISSHPKKEERHLFQQTTIDGIQYVFRTNHNGCSPRTAELIETALKSMQKE